LERQLASFDELKAQLAAALARIEQLERQLYGKKSEKMPSPGKELRKTESPEEREARRDAAQEKRKEQAALKQKLEKETVIHKIPEAEKGCPQCGGTVDRPVGDGKRTTVIEYIPGRFVRREHVQEKLACRCGKHIATAAPPPRALDKSLYGPGFAAHLVTMKCADAIPLYRLAKQYTRVGIPIVRSSLNDLFHGVSQKLGALYQRLLELIAKAGIVQADETPIVMQRPNTRGYMWTFLADNLIAYRFSATRAGKTPADVLGGTNGVLVVDAYTGYNQVTDVDGRERAGCLAHVRRKFFDAKSTAPAEADRALALILDIYRVEHEAMARGIVRTPEHLALRQTRSSAALGAFAAWLKEEQHKHLPKGPLATAIHYAINQWQPLTRFLYDAAIPVDNNKSEGALRIVALGRKNFMTVGNEDLGENLAGLYSLVATCQANSRDPIAYLTDVLIRIDTHPASDIDALLPQNWKPPPSSAASTP
jgi:transposase